MSKQFSRRSFLMGSGMLGVAAAAGALTGCAPTGSADGDSQNLSATGEAKGGTRYSLYENPDEIGIVHDAANEEDFDAVFVGTGIGGMMGAMICAEQMPDAKVLLLDKGSICGGNTNYAERNAPNESVTWAEALAAASETAAESTYLKRGILYAERAVDYGMNSAWLYLKHGVQLHKPASSAIARPMYEGGNGSAVIKRLQGQLDGAEYANLELRLNTRATALLLDDEYTCTGVQILNEDGTYTNINAKAVVLATGGMSNNFDLLQYYSAQDLSKCEAMGENQHGDGHLMAEQTGHGRCGTVALSSMYIHVPGFSIDSLLSVAASMNGSCCYVNQDGERFIDESSPSDIARSKAVEQQGRVFSIIGTGLLNDYQAGKMAHMKGLVGEDRANEPWNAADDLALAEGNDHVFKADTLEELAELMGVPADTFIATMDTYEADCAAGTGDSVFAKPAEHMMSMGEGPFYGFELSSVIFNTNNGIRINRNAQVVDAAFKPVEGLYAAGIAASGFNTEIYYVGTCQSSSVWCGSKAARHLIENCLGGTVADNWYGDEIYTKDSVVAYDNA